jgi:hypothetical protein
MIEEYTDPLIKLMEKAVLVGAFMLVLAITYVYIIEPLLKIKYRHDRAEAIKQLEHQEFLQYKFDNSYNIESTRAGEEVSQLEELKKDVIE